MSSIHFSPNFDGPTIVLPLPQEHASFHFSSQSTTDSQSRGFPASLPAMRPTSSSEASLSSSPKSNVGFFSSWTPASSSIPLSTNPSRKRSRDESNIEAEDLYAKSLSTPDSPSALAAAPIVEEEPIYGEGMVLLNPRTGFAVSAESQTGTWYEEMAEMEKNAAPPLSSRSLQMQYSTETPIPGRKSQRLDNSAHGLDDITLCSIRDRLQRSDSNESQNWSLSMNGASTISNEPRVDDVTCLLGISWQRVSHDDDLAPAVCGWEKYIDKHYYRHLQDARILLQNRSMNAYLVAAQSTVSIAPLATSTENIAPCHFSSSTSESFSPVTCFYLFQEDLNEARLVSSTWEGCLQNLRSVPIAFEGSDIIKAAERSPERMLSESSIPPNTVVGSGIPIAHVTKEHGVSASQSNELDDSMTTATDMRMDIDS